MADLTIHYLDPDDYPSTGEGSHPLWHKYPGQSHPQSAYLSLDCIDGHVWANYNSEIGNAVPMEVWLGHIQRFYIQADLRAADINAMMRVMEPYLQRIVDGYTSAWDGQNEVAYFTDDAVEALRDVYIKGEYDDTVGPCDDECRVCYGDES